MADRDKSFLGRGWSFPPTFDKTSAQLIMVEEDQDIKESLKILLSTSPGERTMQPKYGCGLRALVFEESDALLEGLIKDEIEHAVLMFEPRIRLEVIEVIERDEIEGIILLNLEYTVITTNTRSNIVYPFYFLEGTNVKELQK